MKHSSVKLFLFICALLYVFQAKANGGAESHDRSMPDWLQKEMEAQIGIRKASNAKYQSENEPFSDYVIEWTWGIGKTQVNGRMWGIKDDKPSFDFWEFKLFWDADKKQARLMQWGHGGVMADGFIRPMGEKTLESIQILSSPQMEPKTERHVNQYTPEGLVTTSFEKDEQGQWQEKRSYLWVKQAAEQAE